MSRFLRLLALLALLAAALPVLPAHAQAPDNCVTGLQSSGAIFAICMPPEGTDWNGDLLVYAHGYVAYNEPVAIPQDQLVFNDGTSIPSLINGQGYAFATTSYRENGLAAITGLEDILDLVRIFKDLHPEVQHIYLAGPSEGGLVTVLGIERHPEVFTAGLSLCGPIGDFSKQINYWGDFRVLFDYYFPGVIPGTAMSIPQTVIDNWEGTYKGLVLSAVAAKPAKLSELIRVAKAKYALTDPVNSKLSTVEQLMWYSVFATQDGIDKLGGIPFDNKRTRYIDSSNDFLLNRLVERYTADPAAIAGMQPYQTSGILKVPLVTMHTTGDPVVPYFHETLYKNKITAAKSSALYNHLAIARYGHCSFKSSEALAGFSLMVFKATGKLPAGALSVLPTAAARMDYLRILKAKGIK